MVKKDETNLAPGVYLPEPAKPANGIGNVKPVLFIDGRDLPSLMLRKAMSVIPIGPHARRRRSPRGSYKYGSSRGDQKRKARKDYHAAVMAQQAIEAAFRSKQMSWNQVERALDRAMENWSDLHKLAARMNVSIMAQTTFNEMKEAA